MAQRLDLVTIMVKDLRRMVEFYRGLLGFETDWAGGSYCEFKHEGIRFSMYERQTMDRHFSGLLTYPAGLNGSFEVAIDLPRFEDVDAVFERLVKAGVRPLSPPGGPTPGGLALRACWIADPEGNLIEIGSWNKGGVNSNNAAALAPAVMRVDLVPATEADLPVVTNLSRLYIYDMSAHMGWRCPDDGLFGGCDEFFEGLHAGTVQAYLIRVDGELAGFAAVKPPPAFRCNYMQEFFVLGKFRRRGIGRHVAADLFARYPGPWCVEQLAGNIPAVMFWRRVIADHARGRYSEHQRESPWGPMNVFEIPALTE